MKQILKRGVSWLLTAGITVGLLPAMTFGSSAAATNLPTSDTDGHELSSGVYTLTGDSIFTATSNSHAGLSIAAGANAAIVLNGHNLTATGYDAGDGVNGGGNSSTWNKPLNSWPNIAMSKGSGGGSAGDSGSGSAGSAGVQGALDVDGSSARFFYYHRVSKGGDGGRGASPGIYLPSGAKLTIIGLGDLYATGSKGCGDYDTTDDDAYISTRQSSFKNYGSYGEAGGSIYEGSQSTYVGPANATGGEGGTQGKSTSVTNLKDATMAKWPEEGSEKVRSSNISVLGSTAIPDSGYTFTGWYLNGETDPVSTEKTFKPKGATATATSV